MKKTILTLGLCMVVALIGGTAQAVCVDIYVDAAPNTYGSPDYAAWETAAWEAAADGTFVNMSNGVNPGNVGTTDFEIQDEVVYSFGDLGLRLTWVYWIPNTTLDDLAGRIEVKLENWWDGDYLDFYDYYYGSTWMVPSKVYEYKGGVIGMAGMAWWGAYGVNTQEALDADIAAWGQVEETWVFTVKLDGEECALTSHRDPVPEPATMTLLGLGLAGMAARRLRRK